MNPVLVLNTGSSSIKYRLFDMDDRAVLASGLLERIGEDSSRLEHRTGDDDPAVVEERVADHREGLARILEVLELPRDPRPRPQLRLLVGEVPTARHA